MVEKNTSKYYMNFSHYISCSHITFANPAFTLSRDRVELALTYPQIRLISPFSTLLKFLSFRSKNS